MFGALLTWIVKSQGAKTAGAAASGSVISVAVLMGIMEKNVDLKIDSVNREIISYVDKRHDSVSSDIRYMKENQIEMKEIIKVINQRVYELNQRSKGE